MTSIPDRMPWLTRKLRIQESADSKLWKVLVQRGTACNHGHLIVPDYVLPGYKGCFQSKPSHNPTNIFNKCCPLSNYNYGVIENTWPYECKQIPEKCEEVTPAAPVLRLCKGRWEEWEQKYNSL